MPDLTIEILNDASVDSLLGRQWEQLASSDTASGGPGVDQGRLTNFAVQGFGDINDMKDSVESLVETALIHEANGRHLLLTLKGCDAVELLNDEQRLVALTRRAAEATGATVFHICSQRFSPQGITVVAVLAESHASLHTYPESAVVFWDCFTCGTSCQPEQSVEVLTEALAPGEVEKQVVARG